MRHALASLLISAIAVSGSTAPLSAVDEPPPARKEQPSAAAKPEKRPAKQAVSANYKIRGHCVQHVVHENQPLTLLVVGVRVLLFEVRGRTLPVVRVGETTTDEEGAFEFSNLAPPRDVDGHDRLQYAVVAIARSWGIATETSGFLRGPSMDMDIPLSPEQETLTGTVVNARGRPVAGAIVANFSIDGRAIPDILSATTGRDGRFKIEKVPVKRFPNFWQSPTRFEVFHRDYPASYRDADHLPADVTVSLPDGCTVTGEVIDRLTGRPAASALVHALPLSGADFVTSTDAAGRFRVVAPFGRYTFVAEWPDRVCVGLADHVCFPGQKLELPRMELTAGGLITGRVIDVSTGKPVSLTRSGAPISLGLFGPTIPAGRGPSPDQSAEVDRNGHFTFRAAPGENFPYFANDRGDRTRSNTRKQPPVIVKEGETTAYDMLITPEPAPVKTVVAALPNEPAARTARLLEEFDKQQSSEDDAERWCVLMRELVKIGPNAVPEICEELDRTDRDAVLRRLGFALRAIGDPRAVPALIRAIPKALNSPNSETVLFIGDAKLAEFLHPHDLHQKRRQYLCIDRPVCELFGALHKLTGQDFDDGQVERIVLSEDRRRQILQRRLYFRQARLWQAWWAANWNKFTRDPAYEKVRLAAVDEAFPPTKTLSKTAHVVFDRTAVLSPPGEKGKGVSYFLDLDTGYESRWPTHIPRDESPLDQTQLAKWALENGVDLTCVTRHAPDGTETYVLKAFKMQVREIAPRDVRGLNNSLAAGALPTGRDVAAKPDTGREAGDLLMHYDAQSGHLVPDANGFFLFETRDGSMGLIQVTDRITRTKDSTGVSSNEAKADGAHRGVKFNLISIIP